MIAAHPEYGCIHTLFERAADGFGERPALLCEGRWMSYGDLNARANKLAHCLRKLGVGPETTVALFLERSPELVIAILGVLKAGGTYLPLDTTYPPQRLISNLNDARAQVLLTTDALAQSLPENEGRQLLLDKQWSAIKAGSSENLGVEVSPRNTAYVMYTSGSTGKPKGVMIEHASLVNYVQVVGEAFRIRPEDRVLQFASIGFDTSAEEIFVTLTRGAALVLRPQGMLETPREFFRTCREWRITVLDLPTAFWHRLVECMGANGCELPSTVRLVIIGGEKALPKFYRKWIRSIGRRVRLINMYGPTEATISVTMRDLTAESASQAQVPIGSPIPNCHAHVLDSRLHLVSESEVGELYVGGLCLARGYLRQPRSTAANFIPDPFAIEPGCRLYRTGDMVMCAGEELHFVGRTDSQIKIRGCRVEVAEIEAAIRLHESVADAIVEPDFRRVGSVSLVAYVVPHGDSRRPTTGLLRSFLLERLPEFMVPTAFVLLDSFPLTVSGKLDHRALMSVAKDDPKRETPYQAPTSEMESLLAGIWEDVLGVQRVGVLDGFYELGGDSLSAFSVAAIMRRKLGIELPVSAIFETPNLGALAEAVERLGADAHVTSNRNIPRLRRERYRIA